ncbi:S49 family peptidase [Cupriavidus necator]
MKRELLITEFLSTPWALMPERLTAASMVLARWHLGQPASAEVMESVRADAAAVAARRESVNRAGNGAIAVLPMYGIVSQRGNMADDLSGPGSMSTQRFAQAFRAALGDETIGGILIDVDSPGGSVYGVQELADEIYRARSQKPIVAIANSLAASAAYWIASSAGEFFITPGGEAGSIGVYAAHEDYSKALDAMGVKTTLVSAGKFKTEGNPYQPLDDEARAAMQDRINGYYGAFTRAVARNRGATVAVVREGMGQGRVLSASAAQAENMVDGVATFDEVVRRMAKAIGNGGGKTWATALARREIDLLGM